MLHFCCYIITYNLLVNSIKSRTLNKAIVTMLTLVIGNKNYSTWSLRPWLLLRYFDVPFDEINESLSPHLLSQRLAQYSPSKKVPVLLDNDLKVWDSLAICEYVNEQYLAGKGWPASPEDRAVARAVCAQMHSGFFAIRQEMPMNLRAQRKVELSAEAINEVSQLQNLLAQLLTSSDGPWLFGQFSIADCMFIPVILRFKTYNVSLVPQLADYAQAINTNSAVQQWLASALNEQGVVEVNEVGTECQ